MTKNYITNNLYQKYVWKQIIKMKEGLSPRIEVLFRYVDKNDMQGKKSMGHSTRRAGDRGYLWQMSWRPRGVKCWIYTHHKGVWASSILKVNLLLWCLQWGKLPMVDLIIKQGGEVEIWYSLCRVEDESIDHLFFW